jgi:hypothetical protein
MKFIIAISIIYFYAILNSCNRNTPENDIQLSDFKKLIQLNYQNGNEINTENIFSRSAYLYLHDSILIAHDPYAPNKGIHIFLHKKHYISLGQIGEGENEITRRGPISIDPSGHFLWVADCGRLSYRRHNLKDILQKQENLNLRKFDFKKNFSFEFQPTSDSTLLCMTMEPPYLFEILSEKGEKKVGEIDKIIKSNYKIKYEHCMSTFAFEPNSQSIFLAFRYLDALVKLDKDGNVLFVRKFFDKTGFSKPVKTDNNEIRTFSFLKIIDGKIFVLYSGLDFFRNGSVGETIANYPDKLMIFDLDGNPLTLVKFDTEITDYIYDPKNKELIVYSLNSELYPLMSFNIEL